MATIGVKTRRSIVTNYERFWSEIVKMGNNQFQLMISTAPDKAVAESLAERLIQAKLAACVNFIPQVTSVYHWQGKLERDDEVLMIIKSTVANFSAIEDFLDEHHPYDVPELISCNIKDISASYGQWLNNNLN